MEGSRQVLAQVGLDDAALVARSGDDAHLEEMKATLPALVAAGASFVLTGRAETVQQLRQSLKQQAVPATRVATKAYWAPGKAGLD